jgi:putative Mg2+ transporter-C (MgtC) family protein
LKEILLDIWNISWVSEAVTCVFKLVLATVFGGLIGYEREHSHRPAGFRTHILVAIGSALVMITSFWAFHAFGGKTTFDPTRMGAQVISGIGFLGAGTILREGFTVKGLTTAASLWAVSCVGLAAGAGYYVGATVATVMIYLTLNSLKKFLLKRDTTKKVYIEVSDISRQSEEITNLIHQCGADLERMELLFSDERRADAQNPASRAILKVTVYVKNVQVLDLLTNSIGTLDGVTDVYVD